MLKRIASQQQHLALIFQGVSDCLFLIQVEAGDRYRFVCVNASFLKVTGLTGTSGRQTDRGGLAGSFLAHGEEQISGGDSRAQNCKLGGQRQLSRGQAGGRSDGDPVDQLGRHDRSSAGVVRDITERALAGTKPRPTAANSKRFPADWWKRKRPSGGQSRANFTTKLARV